MPEIISGVVSVTHITDKTKSIKTSVSSCNKIGAQKLHDLKIMKCKILFLSLCSKMPSVPLFQIFPIS